ncbi:DUF808 family protein [Lichenibacterium minor]|uniref:DUF808 family protein n=1 Tax=Lichenibacterium minor TaxID=2316528 RepID=A0A4Q2UA77_9HYPH|nr:DUF808 family protein [Lichenibacterium minor]RYC31946.1 DUF808 family protein [Lichenibacterium minor]
MPSGFFALLDDVAGIARSAAASLDDVAATSGRVGLKAAGVVVDDTAVTPRYVTGLTPDRELPMIGRITLGSLRNKLLILLPAALLLNALAPWAVTPLLMAGGLFLCFEGAEKLVEVLRGAGAHVEREDVEADPRLVEDGRVRGAIRTDLILSAEIMAISLAEVADRPLLVEAVVLALVGLVITLSVYGVVAVVVKVDDVGLHLAGSGAAPVRALGRALVRTMPPVMAALSAVGTAAMIWVGGGILLHGGAALGFAAPAHALDDAASAAGRAVPEPAAEAAAWLVSAAGSGCVGLAVGGAIVGVLAVVARLRG